MLTSVTCTLRTRAPRAKRNTDWLVSSSHRKRVFIKDRISHFSPQPHTRGRFGDRPPSEKSAGVSTLGVPTSSVSSLVTDPSRLAPLRNGVIMGFSSAAAHSPSCPHGSTFVVCLHRWHSVRPDGNLSKFSGAMRIAHPVDHCFICVQALHFEPRMARYFQYTSASTPSTSVLQRGRVGSSLHSRGIICASGKVCSRSSRGGLRSAADCHSF